VARAKMMITSARATRAKVIWAFIWCESPSRLR
jgi:hypothetical protein